MKDGDSFIATEFDYRHWPTKWEPLDEPVFTDIKVKSRDTYGYQGAHGTAYTTTGYHTRLGKRVTLKRSNAFLSDEASSPDGYWLHTDRGGEHVRQFVKDIWAHEVKESRVDEAVNLLLGLSSD